MRSPPRPARRAHRLAGGIARRQRHARRGHRAGIAFTTPDISAPAGKAFVIDFDNEDAGTPHNIQIKDSSGAVKFSGATFNGVATQPYDVPALDAGTYPFQSTVHRTMTGPSPSNESAVGLPGRRMRMEDDGPASARSRNGGAAKRAMFRLLDADGWGWASVKAFLWLIFIIFILGYLPDRAYYLTVSSTVDLGVLVWSPINLCPPTNETLPCPARWCRHPVGQSPVELALPAARTDGSVLQVGRSPVHRRHRRQDRAVLGLRRATVGTGNFDKWEQGPTLPDARAMRAWRTSPAASTSSAVSTARQDDRHRVRPQPRQPDRAARCLDEADDLKLPEGRAGGATAITTDDLLVVGGRNDSGPVATTLRTRLNSQGKLGAWTAEQPMVQPQNDAIAAVVGDYIWVYGGNDATAQSPRSSVVRSGPRLPQACRPIRTRARWSAGT